MREAHLTGTNFAEATLHRVDLSGASMPNVTLAGADLRGSDLSAVDPRAIEFNNAIIDFDQAIVIATRLGLDVRGA